MPFFCKVGKELLKIKTQVLSQVNFRRIFFRGNQGLTQLSDLLKVLQLASDKEEI